MEFRPIVAVLQHFSCALRARFYAKPLKDLQASCRNIPGTWHNRNGEAQRIAVNIGKLPAVLRKQKAPTAAGAKRRGTDWSACMKNRHRVSQVVSKSLSAQRWLAQDIKAARGVLRTMLLSCRNWCVTEPVRLRVTTLQLLGFADACLASSSEKHL
jgi:hypothetical protein